MHDLSVVIYLSFAGNVDGEYVPQGEESSGSSGEEEEEDGVDEESDEEEEDGETDLSMVRAVV